MSERRKVNFMISKEVLQHLHQVIPSGERSNFVNKALEEALIQFARRKACEEMDSLRKEWKLKITNEELISLKNYGRK